MLDFFLRSREAQHALRQARAQDRQHQPRHQQKVISLKQEGVVFEVCNNTLVNKKINYKNDLFDVSEKDIVPSGVAEIANLQQKGYVYIKP